MKTRPIFQFYAGVLVLVMLIASPARAETCPIVDLMPDYWRIVDETAGLDSAAQISRFRAALVTPNGDLYGESGVGFDDAGLDKAIARSLGQAAKSRAAMDAAGATLRQQLPLLIAQFQQSFPDFRCDFPIYLLPSMGQLDGAGRKVNGRPAMLFGVDMIAAFHRADDMPVFVDHELFHRYHHQAAGMSDDDGERAPFWQAMWVEGLATYVSKTLTQSDFGTALFDKSLVANANQVFPDLIAEAVADYDKVDATAYSRFFMGHKPGTMPPPRSGYYLGALGAEALARGMTLMQLAHLTPEKAHERLRAVLLSLQPASAAE